MSTPSELTTWRCTSTGGREVTPRIQGSVWVPDGAIWRLQACGRGHALVGAPGTTPLTQAEAEAQVWLAGRLC